MRILYIDIDSLRPDHLSCYGYHRKTSPNIDRIASRGVRFNNCYASDVPCLPSRTALFGGRFGIHNGVVNHGGVASEPFIEGPTRDFRSKLGSTGWMQCLRNTGYRTAMISSFPERHSAWQVYAGFLDIINPGKCGIETADEVSPLAIDWINRNGKQDNWFLHVNLWDPHTPYRAPDEFVAMFKDAPLPAWYTDEVRTRHWAGCGPHSAREVMGYAEAEKWWQDEWPKQPVVIDSMQQARRMFDGYDAGVRFADEHVGRILNALADASVLDDTALIVSADHGENLGELNIYCDHQTADQFTCRVPLVLRWPGKFDDGSPNDGLIHNLDFAASIVQLAGGKVPANWDGQPGFVPRQSLVVSQGAWSCQRSARWDNWLLIKSLHDGHHAFPELMLFDLAHDPHEQQDVAEANPAVVATGVRILEEWHDRMMRSATTPVDPMQTVLAEGGPFHTRRQLPAYLKRLRATGRESWARILESKHPQG